MVLTGSSLADKEEWALKIKKVYLAAKHELALRAHTLLDALIKDKTLNVTMEGKG